MADWPSHWKGQIGASTRQGEGLFIFLSCFSSSSEPSANVKLHHSFESQVTRSYQVLASLLRAENSAV